jgi:hypothetical protein
MQKNSVILKGSVTIKLILLARALSTGLFFFNLGFSKKYVSHSLRIAEVYENNPNTERSK